MTSSTAIFRIAALTAFLLSACAPSEASHQGSRGSAARRRAAAERHHPTAAEYQDLSAAAGSTVAHSPAQSPVLAPALDRKLKEEQGGKGEKGEKDEKDSKTKDKKDKSEKKSATEKKVKKASKSKEKKSKATKAKARVGDDEAVMVTMSSTNSTNSTNSTLPGGMLRAGDDESEENQALETNNNFASALSDSGNYTTNSTLSGSFRTEVPGQVGVVGISIATIVSGLALYLVV